jgi:hypothetical protein
MKNKYIGMTFGIGLVILANRSFAQDCGPQPEGGCNECGPHTNEWTLDYCPSQTNATSVSPGSFCNKVGDAPTVPTVVVPIYQNGQKETHEDYDCNNAVYHYAGISYSVGSVQWDPPLPGAFASVHKPSFTSQAYVNVTSSDTNRCPNPGRVDIGDPVTWAVIDGGIYAGSYQGSANNGGQKLSINWAQCLEDIKGNVGAGGLANIFNLSEPTTSIYLSANWWRQQKCCPNGGVGGIDKEWLTGSGNYNLSGSIDFTALSAFPPWFQQVVSALASIDPNYAQQLSTITGFGHFNVGADASVSGNTTQRNPFQDLCRGCTAIYTTGQDTLNISVNDSLTSTLFGGVNISVTGYFNGDRTMYGLAITPPNPANQMNIYLKDHISYSLYAYAKVGPWTPGGSYWVTPGSSTIGPSVVDTVCLSPDL